MVAELEQCYATIRKAMAELARISKEPMTAQTLNQMTRWINTKEQHCDKIIHLMVCGGGARCKHHASLTPA